MFLTLYKEELQLDRQNGIKPNDFNNYIIIRGKILYKSYFYSSYNVFICVLFVLVVRFKDNNDINELKSVINFANSSLKVLDFLINP